MNIGGCNVKIGFKPFYYVENWHISWHGNHEKRPLWVLISGDKIWVPANPDKLDKYFDTGTDEFLAALITPGSEPVMPVYLRLGHANTFYGLDQYISRRDLRHRVFVQANGNAYIAQRAELTLLENYPERRFIAGNPTPFSEIVGASLAEHAINKYFTAFRKFLTRKPKKIKQHV